jgi:hypothetical protein
MKLAGYSIIDSTKHILEKNPEYYWEILPATAQHEMAMQKFLLQNRTVITPDGVKRDYPPTVIEVALREISLVFGGTNIPADPEKPVEDGGEPILKMGDPLEKIEKVLTQFPTNLIDELWFAITAANPEWGTCPKKVKSQA